MRANNYSPALVYIYISCFSQSIISNPVYGTNAFGIRIPSGVWLFSSKAATMRGSASAEPFRV